MSLHTKLTPEAQEALRKQKVAATVTSIVIAFLSIALIGVLLMLLLIAIPHKEIETIITYQAPQSEDSEETDQPKVQTNQRQTPKPPASSASVANIITSASVSAVSVPDAQTMTSVESLDFGEVSDFGLDAGFEDSFSSETSFFGSKVQGNRICYVIDYSASMKGERDKLMRAELTKSVNKLRGGADFNLIFFSGIAWQSGDKVKINRGAKTGVVTDYEGKTYQWKAGVPEGTKQVMEWRDPTSQNIEEAVKQIINTPLYFGTRWDYPLEYAMSMDPKPDIIIFMTDGTSGKDSAEMASEIAKKAQRRKIVINTIALMEPKAAKGMKILAEETGGTAIMVKSENEVIDLMTNKLLMTE